MADNEQEAWASEQGAAEREERSAEALLAAARDEADRQRGEAEQYRGMAQRVQADFVNFKRRVEAEREARAEATRAETALAFLPIVDDLERALAHVPARVASEGWAEGFRLIERKLAAILERLGIERVGAEGELFDPNLHEAVAYDEHPSQPEGHIAHVLRSGYRMGERVIRPAQVSVARAPAQAGADEAWQSHRGGQGHGNGGVNPTDLQRPRNIERA